VVAVLAAMTSAFAIGFLSAGALCGVLFAVRRRSKFDGTTRVTRDVIPSFRRSHARLESELARVRRYDHPLAVMVVRVLSDDSGTPARVFTGSDERKRAQHMRRIVSLHMGAILYDCLRSSDLPMWDTERDQYIVVLPECDRYHAELARDRMQRLVPLHLGAVAAVGVAEFPHDGLALEDLVSKAEERCESQPEDRVVPERTEILDTGSLEMVERNVVEPDGMDRRAQSG